MEASEKNEYHREFSTHAIAERRWYSRLAHNIPYFQALG